MTARKKSSNSRRQKTASFRLPDELMLQLRDLAKTNRRTLSGEVQIAIEAHLRNNGKSHTFSGDGNGQLP